MWTIRKGEDRGGFEFGWLSTRHSFSFGDYFDDEWMGFSVLRVINEDMVAPGTGFGMHGHKNMEILTWVLSGTLRHQDSLGHVQDLSPGEIQRMSAGAGIRHAETNPSGSDQVHLLQIWIQPSRPGLAPSYEQIAIPDGALDGKLFAVATPDGKVGSVKIQQDATLLVGRFQAGQILSHAVPAGRKAWVQVAHGSCTVGGLSLQAGDAVFTTDEALVEVVADGDGEVLVFDLP